MASNYVLFLPYKYYNTEFYKAALWHFCKGKVILVLWIKKKKKIYRQKPDIAAWSHVLDKWNLHQLKKVPIALKKKP